MAYIFQPARHELSQQVSRFAHFVTGRVLDVGASSAPRYRKLFPCKEYVTLDIEGVENVDATGTAEAIPFPDSSFDSVVTTQVIGDVYDLRKAFSEFYRVVKPGGVLFLTEAFIDSLHDEPYDYWRFTPHSLRRLAEDSGFTVEVIDPRGGYHSVRAQLWIRYMINRYRVNDRLWSRLFNVYARLYGSFMIWLDRRSRSPVNRAFLHGFLLVARKKA